MRCNSLIKNIIISFILGAAIIIGWHFFIGLHWSKEASYDVLIGAVFEVFLLQAILHFYQQKEQQTRQKELDAHLDKIEKLIEEAAISKKDGK